VYTTCRTAGTPDPLAAAAVGPKTAARLADTLGTTPKAASAWLAEGLRATGVLVRVQAGRRIYWLPGVGIFPLVSTRRAGGPPIIGGPIKLMPQPEIRSRPQARTRGLLRLRAPSAAPAATQTAAPA
jgi:hypothetical protein